MFEYATSRASRTVLTLAMAVSVGMTGLAGTAQAGDYDDDDDDYKAKKVAVEICKKVRDKKDDDYGYGYGDKSKEKKFLIHAKTDEDEAKYRLKDDECKTKYLEYYKNKVVVHEDYKHQGDYKVRYEVKKGGDGKERNGKFVVWFDAEKKHPYVKIIVINKEKKDHDYYKTAV